MINGRGVIIWANGNRFDGQWENGAPKGHGIFTWPDGNCYIGTWNKENCYNGVKHQIRNSFPPQQVLNGTFYPGNNNNEKGEIFAFNQKLSAPLMDENLVPKKRSSVEGRGSLTERNFPRICIWESDGEAGDITCDIIDTVEATMLYRETTLLDQDRIKQFRRNGCCFSGEAKKPGQMISKGHKHYDLMLNLQLGIR